MPNLRCFSPPMDVTATATATRPTDIETETTTTTTTISTPPHTHPPTKSLSFPNGGLKRHHSGAAPLLPVVLVSYKECLKNHAASLGGHALDGCGEFMPSPTSTPADPTSLKCAACGCHRNFHRRDPDEPTTHVIEIHRHPLGPPRRSSPSPSPSPPPPPHPSSYYSSAPQMLLALSSGGAGRSDEHQIHPITVTRQDIPNGRKRFRTKFSQEQKEKMFSFSEKLGWKMQKSDEGLVEEFCNEVGVGKGVLKVWMHNNKHTFGKRDISSNNNNNNDGHDTIISFATTNGLNNINGDSNHNEKTCSFDDHHQQNHLHHLSTNGSSSSS
ncbi:hypothetical protein VitviT2T_000963 [Vitis vinifera]|uniref:ZF-HD dimerization-type domain-containing protein n=3 Tax=Vitis vinifera TaxID=29760 RepID=A0ABY9BE70_VITVI|nr:zinc-finger homeodomain protein 11 [Vitis vinifera]RVW68235.1 Zinc-finger homeodomain protein 11 [Vitis vinifera]WJZ81105.1 hypothetical protein VitviT2T_000963 [Vitis vinifera]|eukprot:XP_002273802.1 PREDICTED: zinc-finger homeodomain protein 11 [Vitis vinifera]